ncbi:MAG: MaoC/PaaZ C-terminal domain-containing protein [Syntrophales bacterium]|nr:MaoC/PaaZ C-terminal domain-containing protein [Syntrophales bacterium]
MSINLDAANKSIGPLVHNYTWRDVIIYALGVGAGSEELQYVYEKNLKVIPTFSVATIIEFLFAAAKEANVNLSGILHGGQELIFHRPIPVSGTFTTTGSVAHVYDKKDKGAVIIAPCNTHHDSGGHLFTAVFTIFSRFDGNFGGEDVSMGKITIPDREEDFTVNSMPSPDQPLLYRLSGDYFALHVDPEFARNSGFEKPIMHGLCTLGYACRALMGVFVPGMPEKVRRIKCRFTRPLYPGNPIETLIWKTGEGQALWQCRNRNTGEIIIDGGEFEYDVRT